ncbi:MAG TPA: D-alanyl-D-alanine carboxypeptidase/D-alanyl-D-alanine-endopeptidase [Anaeromyxobacter sp.]|nr:D-alanyl-D-alanine carboxypeptidase/D-alanyl-D-alanine-endopeptidase [Anaeromyxobacter sp.]
MTFAFRGTFLLAALLASTPAAGQPDADLKAAFQSVVDGSPLAQARTGILVATVDTGEVVYARDPDALLNPASNVKLVTTAAALARLGPEYRFATEFLVDGPSTRELKALYVRGRGDPSLVTERLWAVAGDLWHLGLRRVDELVLDDGYFDGDRFGPGFDQEDGDRAYLAPAGALSLNFNAVEVHVTPADRPGMRASVELEPMSQFFQVENRTLTAGRSSRARVMVSTRLEGERERVVVEGRVPVGSRPHLVWRRIDDPALYLGHTLAALLKLRGVTVGKVRAGRAPDEARLLYVAQSDSLSEIVRRLNKTSNNFTAEQLLKTLGAEGKGPPGTWAKGVEVTEDFLAELGLPRGTYVMRNGSGLNDTNRFSARQLVAVLRAMWSRFPLQPEYVVSLPVAARDGTIRWRMDGTAAAGRLRAKTGSLEGVVALSGYVENAAGKVLAFAVLVNDSPGRPGALRAVDGLGAVLAASGAPPAAQALPAATTTARPAPADLEADLPQRLRTYYALARSGDVRNQGFLRSALRRETDPVTRLALAECAYLSDPDGESSRRAFLDALAAEPAALPRLFALLPGEPQPPVVSSLADLGAEGSPEPLRRLVDLGGREIPDERLATAIGDALAGVADSAPEELVAALRAAPPSVGEAAAGRLAAGLSRSDDKDHPFLAVLRAMASRGDEAAEYAARLSAQLDAERPAATSASEPR